MWLIIFAIFITFTIDLEAYIAAGAVAVVLVGMVLIVAILVSVRTKEVRHAVLFGLPDLVCFITILGMVIGAGTLESSIESSEYQTWTTAYFHNAT
jgi:membrane protein required for beta-lactamase induction